MLAPTAAALPSAGGASRVHMPSLLQNMCRTGAPAAIAFLQQWATHACGSLTHFGGGAEPAAGALAARRVLNDATEFFTAGAASCLDAEPWRAKGIFFLGALDMAMLWDALDVERGAAGKRGSVQLPPSAYLKAQTAVTVEGFGCALAIKEPQGAAPCSLNVSCGGVAVALCDYVGGAADKAVTLAPLKVWLQRGTAQIPPALCPTPNLPAPSPISLLSDPAVFHEIAEFLARRGDGTQHTHLFVWAAAAALAHHSHCHWLGDAASTKRFCVEDVAGQMAIFRTLNSGLTRLGKATMSTFSRAFSGHNAPPEWDFYCSVSAAALQSLRELEGELGAFRAAEDSAWCQRHACLHAQCRALQRTGACATAALNQPPGSSALESDFVFQLGGLTLRASSSPLPLCVLRDGTTYPTARNASPAEEPYWWRRALPPLAWPGLVPPIPLRAQLARHAFPLHAYPQLTPALDKPLQPPAEASSATAVGGTLALFQAPQWTSTALASHTRALRRTARVWEAAEALQQQQQPPAAPLSTPRELDGAAWTICPRAVADRSSLFLLALHRQAGDFLWGIPGGSSSSTKWHVGGGAQALALWRLTAPAGCEDDAAAALVLESQGFVLSSIPPLDGVSTPQYFLELIQANHKDDSLPPFLLLLAPSAAQRDAWVGALGEALGSEPSSSSSGLDLRQPGVSVTAAVRGNGKTGGGRKERAKSERRLPAAVPQVAVPATILELQPISVFAAPAGVRCLQRLSARIPTHTSGELEGLRELQSELEAFAVQSNDPIPARLHGAYREDISQAGSRVAYFSAVQSALDRMQHGHGGRVPGSANPIALGAPKEQLLVTLPSFLLSLPLSKIPSPGSASALVVHCADIAASYQPPGHLLEGSGGVLGAGPAIYPSLYTPALTATLTALTCWWGTAWDGCSLGAPGEEPRAAVFEARGVTLSQTSLGGSDSHGAEWGPLLPNPRFALPAAVMGCNCEAIVLSPLHSAASAAAFLSFWQQDPSGDAGASAREAATDSRQLAAPSAIVPPSSAMLLCLKSLTCHLSDPSGHGISLRLRDLRARQCGFPPVPSAAQPRSLAAAFAELEVRAVEAGAPSTTCPLLSLSSNGPLPALSAMLRCPGPSATSPLAQEEAAVLLQTVALSPCPAFAHCAMAAAQEGAAFMAVLQARSQEDKSLAAAPVDAAVTDTAAPGGPLAEDSSAPSPPPSLPPLALIPPPAGFQLAEKVGSPGDAPSTPPVPSPWVPLPSRSVLGHLPFERASASSLASVLPAASLAAVEVGVGLQAGLAQGAPVQSRGGAHSAGPQQPHCERYDGHIAQLSQWRLSQDDERAAAAHLCHSADPASTAAHVFCAIEELVLDVYNGRGCRLVTASLKGFSARAHSASGLAHPAVAWDSFKALCLDDGATGSAASPQAFPLPLPAAHPSAWSGVTGGVVSVRGGSGALVLTASGATFFLLDRLSVSVEPDPRELPLPLQLRFYAVQRSKDDAGGDGAERAWWTPGSRANAHLVKEVFTLAPVSARQASVITGEAALAILSRALLSPSPDLAHAAFATTPSSAHCVVTPAVASATPAPPLYLPAVYYEAYSGGGGGHAGSEGGAPPTGLAAPGESTRPGPGSPQRYHTPAAGHKAFYQPTSLAHVSLAAMAITADALCLGTIKRTQDCIAGAAQEFQPLPAPPPPPPPPPPPTLRPTLAVPALGDEPGEGDAAAYHALDPAVSARADSSAGSAVAPAATPPPWAHMGIELGVGIINLCTLPTLSCSSGKGAAPELSGGAAAAPLMSGSGALPQAPASAVGVSLPLATVVLSRAYLARDAASVLKVKASPAQDGHSALGRSARGSRPAGEGHSSSSTPLSWHGPAPLCSRGQLLLHASSRLH